MWLLCGYCVVTVWLLCGYCVVTASLRKGMVQSKLGTTAATACTTLGQKIASIHGSAIDLLTKQQFLETDVCPNCNSCACIKHFLATAVATCTTLGHLFAYTHAWATTDSQWPPQTEVCG